VALGSRGGVPAVTRERRDGPVSWQRLVQFRIPVSYHLALFRGHGRDIAFRLVER